MLDNKLLKNQEDLAKTAQKLASRGFELDVSELLDLESKRKQVQTETEALQSKRNTISQQIGKAKAQGEDISPLLTEVGGLGKQLKEKESTLADIQNNIKALVHVIPNIPDDSVPLGKNEDDNKELKTWGEKTVFDFTPKEHADLKNIGLDFESASKLSGARFAVMQGDLAHLHRALAQFMLNTHTQSNGYCETIVPLMVNEAALFGTSQLPKFGEDLYKVDRGEDSPLYLIPTSEVPLTNLVQDTILSEAELPKKFTSHTPCFRSEAGSHGKDVRGLIRQHQFEKIEMVQITKPEDSYTALEEMLSHAEGILQQLKLPYRVVTLCTGDMGFSAAKTYDIEVWLPGQNKYREISSISNCQDFQARRLKARYKNKLTNKTELVHTLNGSGLAVGRTIVAILENYQNADGSISVPEILIPYMAGKTLISSKNQV